MRQGIDETRELYARITWLETMVLQLVNGLRLAGGDAESALDHFNEESSQGLIFWKNWQPHGWTDDNEKRLADVLREQAIEREMRICHISWDEAAALVDRETSERTGKSSSGREF